MYKFTYVYICISEKESDVEAVALSNDCVGQWSTQHLNRDVTPDAPDQTIRILSATSSPLAHLSTSTLKNVEAKFSTE